MTARRLPWLRWATALAALALLVRMMVPAGFMPMARADGLRALVICPGQQVQPMPAMAHHAPGATMNHGSGSSMPGEHGGDNSGDHSCPFGALAASADMADTDFALPLPPVAVTRLLIAPLFLRPGIGLAAPPPPKTGPPSPL